MPMAPETPLSFKSFYEIKNELITKNRAERLQIPGMIEMRVDMIVVACCLIDFLLDRHKDFQSLRVSSYSLKEGVLATLFK
jgi:exopolyphosphatase / guanosine-5'-triphosphate,3'-diphosphate pyrophosphatase